MNKIKAILVAMCIVCTVLFSCTTDENSKPIETEELSVHKIGVFEDGEYHFFDEQGIKSKWEAAFQEKENDFELNDLDVVTGDFNGDGNEVLILVATSKDARVKIATEIKVIESNGKVEIVGGGTTTIKCEGCTEGCSPKKKDGKWTCTKCAPGEIYGCVKTETVTEDSTEIITP